MAAKKHLIDRLWDAWCILSVLGIWPRFIEPNTVSVTRQQIHSAHFPKELEGLRILQFSDIHLNPGMSDYFLRKVKNQIKKLDPDIIVFTGDFLCYARFADKERLKEFFKTLPKAPYGNYAIFGNHDYAEYAYVNDEGDYDISKKASGGSIISKGFSRLFGELKITTKITQAAIETPVNQELVDLIKETPFTLLHNETTVVPIRGTHLNICGLGEYMIGKMKLTEAFVNYDKQFPGLILVHNPDAIPHLLEYPADLILCGHTHGGQINLPWIWRKFVVMENLSLVKGLVKDRNRWVYVNRGLGSVLNFRWFCLPEITLFELKGS